MEFISVKPVSKKMAHVLMCMSCGEKFAKIIGKFVTPKWQGYRVIGIMKVPTSRGGDTVVEAALCDRCTKLDSATVIFNLSKRLRKEAASNG